VLDIFWVLLILAKQFNLNKNQILKPCAARAAGGAGF